MYENLSDTVPRADSSRSINTSSYLTSNQLDVGTDVLKLGVTNKFLVLHLEISGI